jgi:hypothetical protein
MSDPAGTITCVSHGAVRVRLDVTNVQAGMLLRAAGARRFAWNWAVAKIKANTDRWGAEASYGIGKGRPGAAGELLHPGEAVDRGEAGYRPGGR